MIYRGNQNAVHILANLIFHEHTEHLEIDYHFVRDKLLQETFKLLHVSSQAQLVDFSDHLSLVKSYHRVL